MFVHVYSSTKEIRMKPIIIAILLFSSLLAQNKADDVKTFALKNGMQIIVLEDHSIPNVAMYLFYKVGWRNEYPGITGNSHFFEHMMFNGAKKYGLKENLHFVIIGKSSDIKDIVKKDSEITEKEITAEGFE